MHLCVFCGSRDGNEPAYRQAAIALGQLMARRNIGLVYGGATAGLMGACADAALEQGGEVIGVMPELLMNREIEHVGLTQFHVVESLQERKAMMSELSDGFVVLPGGLGTFDELFEIWTWSQLGLHTKPFGLLNVNGYYDLFEQFLDQVAEHGFVGHSQRQHLLSSSQADDLLDQLTQH